MVLALQDDPKYKQALRVRNPEERLRAFLAVCGSMRTDDSGGQQPKYRMDTFRIMAEFEKPKVCPLSRERFLDDIVMRALHAYRQCSCPALQCAPG